MEKKNHFKILSNSQRGLVLLSALSLQTILGIATLMTGLGIHLQQGDQLNGNLNYYSSDSLSRIINYCSKHLPDYNPQSCERVLGDNPNLTQGLHEFHSKILGVPAENFKENLAQVFIKSEKGSATEPNEIKLSLLELMGNWHYGKSGVRYASYEVLEKMTLEQLLGSPVSQYPKKGEIDLMKFNYGALADLAYRTMNFHKYGPQ